MQLIIGITGSSGVLYGIKMLEILQTLGIESHLVISEWGERNIRIETDKTVDYVKSIAKICYEPNSHFKAMRSSDIQK